MLLGSSAAFAQSPSYQNIGFPMRGTAPWTALLCHYNDETPSRPRSYYENWLANANAQGFATYIRDVSRGLLPNDMRVLGWFTIPKAYANRGNTSFEDCVNQAKLAGHPLTDGRFTMVLTLKDTGARPYRSQGVLAPGIFDGMAHEFFHVYGLVDNRAHFAIDYQSFVLAPGEMPLTCYPTPTYEAKARPTLDCLDYGDPFDVMSFATRNKTIPSPSSPLGGNAGPALNAFHLDRFGWLASDEVRTFGANGETSAAVTLTPLYAPSSSNGTRLIRVPFNPGDRHQYYQIELRQATGWDGGFVTPRVLIYEVKRAIDGRFSAMSGDAPQSYLLAQLPTAGTPPLQTLSANGVTIQISSIAPNGSSAVIQVSADIAKRCLMGWVWRAASPADLVCVRGEGRLRVAQENRLAASRRQPGGGAFGPDTCVAGFVWRDAFVGDRVCVTGVARTLAANENQQAPLNTNPARQVEGPNACKSGFVFRKIDKFDYVCVTPQRKAQVDIETSLNVLYRSLAPRTPCIAGAALRNAFPGDDVCAPASARALAQADAAAAWARVERQLR